MCLHIIEAFERDPRENIRELVFIDYAADVLGEPISDLISSVIAFADEAEKNQINSFLDRPKDVNKLACFGVRCCNVGGKTKFIRLSV